MRAQRILPARPCIVGLLALAYAPFTGCGRSTNFSFCSQDVWIGSLSFSQPLRKIFSTGAASSGRFPFVQHQLRPDRSRTVGSLDFLSLSEQGEGGREFFFCLHGCVLRGENWDLCSVVRRVLIFFSSPSANVTRKIPSSQRAAQKRAQGPGPHAHTLCLSRTLGRHREMLRW